MGKLANTPPLERRCTNTQHPWSFGVLGQSYLYCTYLAIQCQWSPLLLRARSFRSFTEEILGHSISMTLLDREGEISGSGRDRGGIGREIGIASPRTHRMWGFPGPGGPNCGGAELHTPGENDALNIAKSQLLNQNTLNLGSPFLTVRFR